MAYDYSKRRLVQVNVFGFSRMFGEGESSVQGSVQFSLSGFDGSDLGPFVTVQLAIADAPEKSVHEIEGEFLDSAFAILEKLAADPSVDLQSILRETREKALMLPKS